MNNTPVHLKASKAMVIAAFAAIYIIWGSTYLGILYAIKSIPPFFMAGTRFLVAGILLLSWCAIKGEKMPNVNSILKISFSGLLMLFIGNGAVTWVEQYLPSGLAAIIVATVPLWFVLIDKREWKFYFANKGIIIGLIIGFGGVILLFAGNAATNIFDSPIKIISLFVLMAGTIGWTIGSLYAKYQKMEGSTTMKVGLQMLAAGIAFAVTGFASGEQNNFAISEVSKTSIIALLYLIFFGSLIGYLAYMWLLSVRPASLVGTYAYVNPVVAVFLGWLFVNEKISTQQIIGLGIIILGLLMVNFYKEKRNNITEETAHVHNSLKNVQVSGTTKAQ